MTTLSLDRAVQQFASLRGRARAGIWTETLGMVLLALLGYALVTWPIDRNLRLEWPFRLVLLAGLVYGAARIVRRRLVQPLSVRLDDDEMAFAVERRSPELRQALISSLQFERALGGSGDVRVVESRELMTSVITEMHGRLEQVPFAAAIDAARVRKFTALIAGVLVAFVAWGVYDVRSLGIWTMRNLLLSSSVEWPRYTQLAFAGTAGDTIRLPQGDSFTVKVAASGVVPDQAFLRYTWKSGDSGVEPMSRTGDGEFSLTMDALLEDATLVAEGGDGISAPLHIAIVERPRIDGVAIQVQFPEYMHKDPETVPPTEGELRLLRGSKLVLKARTHKPATEAFALFEDEKIPLALDATKHEFGGEYTPKAGGLLKLDVIDQDQLGAGAPPRILVRMVDDKPPTIDFKPRGISTLITAQARIPGDLKVKDDFGVTDVLAVHRLVDDAPQAKKPGDEKDAKPAEVPFAPIEVGYADPLTKGATKYETSASIDLKPLAERPGSNIKPGMLLSLRFQAKDNFGPGDPHLANGEILSFRVVTIEKMLEELRRRQVEQRQELERIREDERTALLELKDTMNPNSTDERAKQARARFKALARQQQGLGRRVAFVGEAYQRILWEFENNRLLEPGKVRDLEAVTSVPLAGLAREPFPGTAKEVDEFANAGDEKVRTSAATGYEQILARLDAIIKIMGDAETLAAIIELTKGVIKTQDSSVQEAEKRIKEAARTIFDTPRKTELEKPNDKKK